MVNIAKRQALTYESHDRSRKCDGQKHCSIEMEVLSSYLMYNCVGTRTYLLILVKADKIKVRKPLRNVLYAMAFDQFLKNLLIT